MSRRQGTKHAVIIVKKAKKNDFSHIQRERERVRVRERERERECVRESESERE